MVVASLLISFSLFAGGCSKPDAPSEEMKPAVTAPAPAAEEIKIDTGEDMGEVESIESTYVEPEKYAVSEGRTNGPMLPIYFNFDKSDIRDDQQSRLDGNADFLKANNQLRIIVEGNCDERGTNEYNIALGERRAQSAKKYLVNLGVAEERINTVSFGEEKPLLHGHDELSWAQNRRDDFIIR